VEAVSYPLESTTNRCSATETNVPYSSKCSLTRLPSSERDPCDRPVHKAVETQIYANSQSKPITLAIVCCTYIVDTSRDDSKDPLPSASKQAPCKCTSIINPSRLMGVESPLSPLLNAKRPVPLPVLVHIFFHTSRSSVHFRQCAQSSKLDIGFSSNHFSNVWYMTSIVPLCTLVHTPLGPTPLNQPATPSVR
jgi:hypothetical protein